MAVPQWVGGAPPVAQVDNHAFGGTWITADVVTVTINSKALNVTAGSTTITTIIDNVVTAFNALETDEWPEFSGEITASRSGSNLLFTAKEKGVPFTATVTENSAAGTITPSTTTVSSGPKHWDTATNWSTATVPITGDTVWIQDSDDEILYGIDQNSVTLAALHLPASFTGQLGLPQVNAEGDAEYGEYRQQYLKIGSTLLNIGAGEGSGSSFIKIDNVAVATTARLDNSSTGDGELPAVLWKGTSASNAWTITKGELGIAVLPNETANVSGGLTIGLQGSESDAKVICGSGVTLPSTITQHGGELTTESNLSTVNHLGGEHEVLAGAVSTLLNIQAGSVIYKSAGTIASLVVASGSTIDFEQNPRARTVTTANTYHSSNVWDKFGTVTWGTLRLNMVDLNLTDEVNMRLGPNVALAITRL